MSGRERSTKAVEVRDLVVRYDDTLAVDRVSLSAPTDSILALVGPSGCGKTSLLRTIAGFETPLAGEVLIGEKVVAGNGSWVAPEDRQVGMVFQQGALFPHMTVRKNVLYGVAKRLDASRRAEESLELVGLARLADRYPDQLSGGQQQLVALARALAPSPKLVLLDEPFANLDAGLRARLRQEVRTILERARMTAILVTHDQEEALSLAATVAVMGHGRILQTGSPEEIYHRPATVEVAEFIGGGQLLRCSVVKGRLESALGSLTTDAPDGTAQLLVRPEEVLVSWNGARGGAAGKLARQSFFGHDLLNEIRMSTGETVTVRTLNSVDRAHGSRVRLTLRPGPYRVYRDNGTTYLAEAVKE
jgi:iron(III) transport system ATP-binding protein